MNRIRKGLGGIRVAISFLKDDDHFLDSIKAWCDEIGISAYTEIIQEDHNGGRYLRIYANELLLSLCQNADTSRIALSLGLFSEWSARDLALETILSMAISPIIFDFPNLNELQANLRMRIGVASLARRTELNFDTSEISRPEMYWTHEEDKGFILKEGASLVDGIEHALCPDISGRHYSFSCQRATEYLMLHSLTTELGASNPQKLMDIELQWQRAPLIADNFLNSFLLELGTLQNPFPMHFYVPGDRVWFKNPDDFSSDLEGFEGSWVIYLGCGQFSNFWDKSYPYTLETKCLEIYHWRHGVRKDKSGSLEINEDYVKELVYKTLSSELELQKILNVMMRYRDPQGVFGEGGCIDKTRDTFRWVYPQSSNIEIRGGL
jgi:Protein-glutamine gamma-glutamyltransferase